MNKTIKNLELRIIESIQRENKKTPVKFQHLNSLPYQFTKPIKMDKNIYKVEINLININGFYYPEEIFSGEIEKKQDLLYLYLKPKYQKYGICEYFTIESFDTDYTDLIEKRTYFLETKEKLFIDKETVSPNIETLNINNPISVNIKKIKH